jgi:hypothetical protein
VVRVQKTFYPTTKVDEHVFLSTRPPLVHKSDLLPLRKPTGLHRLQIFIVKRITPHHMDVRAWRSNIRKALDFFLEPASLRPRVNDVGTIGVGQDPGIYERKAGVAYSRTSYLQPLPTHCCITKHRSSTTFRGALFLVHFQYFSRV